MQQRLQWRRRVQAELVAEEALEAAVNLEGFRGPAGPVERQHLMSPGSLAQGVLRDENLEVGQCGQVATCGQQRLEPGFDRAELIPSFEQVKADKFAFAEATRFIHTNTNPFNAVTLVLNKRLGRDWWGGSYTYTWSRLKDNQFGEDSAYQTRTAVPQNVYDLDAEYAISNFDSPHRILLSPIVGMVLLGMYS